MIPSPLAIVCTGLLAVVTLPSFAANAAEEAAELLTGKSAIIQTGRTAKIVAKSENAITMDLPDAANYPSVVGAELTIRDAGGGAGTDTYPLPAGGWLGLGSPPGAKGWKYIGLGTAGDPCRRVVLKSKVLKAVCRGPDVALAPPFSGAIEAELSIGAGAKRYCASLGGKEIKNEPGLTKRKRSTLPSIRWGSEGAASGEFDQPSDVAVNASGDVYVADRQNHRVQKFDADGTFLLEWGSYGGFDGSFLFPRAIAVSAGDNVYVADNGNRIQKFDASGAHLLSWGSSGSADGEFVNPDGIAVDASGDVYVGDSGNSRIQKFDANGVFLTKWGSFGTANGQFAAIKDVATDGSGNVYVVEGGANDRIQKFDTSGVYLAQWGEEGSGKNQIGIAGGLAADHLGDVYLSGATLHRIQKFDPGGALLALWGHEGDGDAELQGPSGIDVGPSGRVYVVDGGNDRVHRFGCP